MTEKRNRDHDYRARLKAAGEPPSYVAANAIMAAVLEAREAGETSVDPADLIRRAASNVAANPAYREAAVHDVINRFVRPSLRKPRDWSDAVR
jgi:hypothetical protein